MNFLSASRLTILFSSFLALGLLAGCGDGSGPGSGANVIATAGIPCPPQMETENLGPNTPVQDIAGLRPGMSFEQVVAILACRGDVPQIEYAPLWNLAENYGIATRQLIRASDGQVCSGGESRAAPAICEDAAGRLRPLKNFTQEFAVVFTGLPGQERAHAIWRHQSFPEGDYPETAELVTALTEKYGQPHMDRNTHHFYISKIRHGSIPLYWLYRHPSGTPHVRPDGGLMRTMENYRDCANGPTPWFGTRRTWNTPLFNPRSEWRGHCGLTIRAEIVPVAGNPARASELNVVVMNQTTLLNESRSFEEALREVGQVGGATPDL